MVLERYGKRMKQVKKYIAGFLLCTGLFTGGCVDQSQGAQKAATDHAEEVRIVATSGSTCHIMDRLELDLVGIPTLTTSSLPERYIGLPEVGNPMGLDMEIIKSLQPTDVIGPDTLQGDYSLQYDNIGVTGTFINLRSVQGMYDSIAMLGAKYDREQQAEKLVKEYESYMADYLERNKRDTKPRVLVLMGLPGSYLVCTQNSYAGSLVELAGAENVFHHESKDFLNVNTEEILKTDPDIIIRTAHGLPDKAKEMFAKEFSENDIWKHFRAVEEGKVYDVDYMLFGMSATFDYPQALADLETVLYGDGDVDNSDSIEQTGGAA